MWSRTVAAAFNWVLVLLFCVLFFHSRSWVPAHNPNLKREREKARKISSNAPLSLRAHLQRSISTVSTTWWLSQHRELFSTSSCNMLNFSLGNPFVPIVKPRSHRNGPRSRKATTRVVWLQRGHRAVQHAGSIGYSELSSLLCETQVPGRTQTESPWGSFIFASTFACSRKVCD